MFQLARRKFMYSEPSMNGNQYRGSVVAGSLSAGVVSFLARNRSNCLHAAGAFTLVLLGTGFGGATGAGRRGVASGPRESLLMAIQKFSC